MLALPVAVVVAEVSAPVVRMVDVHDAVVVEVGVTVTTGDALRVGDSVQEVVSLNL